MEQIGMHDILAEMEEAAKKEEERRAQLSPEEREKEDRATAAMLARFLPSNNAIRL